MTRKDVEDGVKQYADKGAAWVLRLLIAALLGVTIKMLTGLTDSLDTLEDTMKTIQIEVARDYLRKQEAEREFEAIKSQIDRHVDRYHRLSGPRLQE